VAALQYLHAGLEKGEKVVMMTTVEGGGIPEMARAWGMSLDTQWKDGSFRLFGFKDDFEMRVLRSAEPLEVFEELQDLVPPGISRIAVDPGSMFLRNGSRTLLGKAFLDWAKRHPATVFATLSVDSAESLPSSTEWLVQATDAILQIDRRSDGLYQVRVNRAFMGTLGEDDPITLQLTPGRGLTEPEAVPSRRRADRPAGAAERLLLITLDETRPSDLIGWAENSFRTEVVREPLEAVTMLQGGAAFGGILVHATRKEIKEATHACRAIRPLTGAGIVFSSDDTLRSTDRVQLLEAGADDCLSGGVDFRELETRLRQAVSIGGKPPSGVGVVRSGSGGPLGGTVTPMEFESEMTRRSLDPSLAVFSVICISAKGMSAGETEQAIAEAIRDQEGDMVTCAPVGCLVLLQGARRKPAQAFLARFRSNLVEKTGADRELKVELLAPPVEKEELDDLIARWAEGTETGPESEDSGGPNVRKK
jgi:hypothetical protein